MKEIDSLSPENDDYIWPMSIKNFCKNFDLNRNTVHKHKRDYLTKGEDYFIEDRGPDRAICFERSGALKILKHSRSEKGVRYLQKCGLSISPKEEHLYITTIKYAIQGFDIAKKEFKVNTKHKNYKIDLYLRNFRLAIECDEHDHYNQEYTDESSKREEEIKKVLECRFLRFNPHEPDFNIGELINVIFHYIFNKLIKEKDAIDYYMEKRKDQRTIRERYYPKLTEEELAEFE